MRQRRSDHDVTNSIKTTDSPAVAAEVRRIYLDLFRKADLTMLDRSFIDFATLYAGENADYHAPARVSKEIVTRLNAEIVKALSKPEVKDQLFKQGIEAQIMTPAEFTKHVRAEVAKMGKIIKASGAKAEQ